MPATIAPPRPQKPAGWPFVTAADEPEFYRFSQHQLDQILAAGILTREDDVEFRRGIVVRRSHNGHSTPYRFSVEKYDQMVIAGVFAENEKAELIFGEVVGKMPRGEPHDIAIEDLARWLSRYLPEDVGVRNQSAIRLPDGEPEPDLTVCLSPRDRGRGHPTAEQIHWVAEVSASTLAYDRGIKASLYAVSGIPIYWIVNLIDGQIEVYTDPEPLADGDGHYRTRTDYRAGQRVPMFVEGRSVGELAVDAVLPELLQA